MADNRILYDAFNIYYEKGMDALRERKFDTAQRNILSAAETLLKLAKESTGDLRAQRVKRADELYNLAKKIEEKQQLKKLPSSASSDLENIGGTSKKEETSQKAKKEDENLTDFVPVTKTGVSMSDVAGLDSVKEEVRKKIIEPQLHPEIYKRFSMDNHGGILMYGVPGTGKTMIAQAIATELDAAFFSVKCSDIITKYYGDSEQNIKNLFEQARKFPRSIIFFDEFEGLAPKRGNTRSSVMRRVVNEMLAQMQGFEGNNDSTLLLIAATNRPWDIDSAFLRPGRFNNSIYIPLPDDDARAAIVSNKLKKLPIEDDFDYSEVVRLTKGFNGADVVEFCNRLKEPAVRRSIETGTESCITNADVIDVASTVHSSVREEDLVNIQKFEENPGQY